MPQSLKGKVVLVTGGGSGIGRATAIKLSKIGALVAVTDVKGAAETLELCEGALHYAGVMDVSKATDVAVCLGAILARFGCLDHVFNCAGVNPTSYALTETTDAYWDRLMDVNLRGVYNVTRATIPRLTSPGGSYVNVSSICGLHGVATQAIYCATKFGVIGFSKAMALELGPKGIRTNIIAPGYIDTPTNAGVVRGGDSITMMEQGNSLGRMGTADEVADVAIFLMSDEARYMNGSTLEIDGGLGNIKS